MALQEDNDDDDDDIIQEHEMEAPSMKPRGKRGQVLSLAVPMCVDSRKGRLQGGIGLVGERARVRERGGRRLECQCMRPVC